MIRIVSFSILIFLALFTLWSCEKTEGNYENLALVAPTMHAEIIRFEELLRSLPSDNLPGQFDMQLAAKYPSFSKLYARQIVNAQNPEKLKQELELTRNDSSYLQLYDEVRNSLGDLSEIRPLIDQTLENYLDLFNLPSTALPRVFTFISGFAYQAFVFDDNGKNGIGLGLDMFLGSDFPYQKIHPADPSFSQYLSRTYNREHIVRKISEVLVEDQMIPPSKSDFLTLMIWGGKKMYLIDQILDFVPDTIVTEYTPDQLQWCRENEAQIWQYFFEQELFYETDLRKFSKLIGPAPTSPGMPKAAPGQTGNYMGWQIIRAYMDRYPGTSVKELITMQDAQLLLDLSKYKPPR